MSSGFEEYIDIWSGYDEYVNGVKEKLNISGDIQLGDLDKKVWIIEKLLGKDINTSRIQANFENQMQNYKNSTVESAEASNVTIDFQRDYYNNYFQKEILDRYEGAFALQAFYKFDGAYYDVNRAKYVVDDLAAFNASTVEYLNAVDNSLEDKVYLSKVLNMQEGRFLGIDYEYVVEYKETFSANGTPTAPTAELVVSATNLTQDVRIYLGSAVPNGDTINTIISQRLRTDAINEIISKVTDSELASLLSTTINTNTRNIHVYDKDKTYSDNNALIFGSEADDIIISSGANATVLAGKGDDAITTGSGSDTITYRQGDGSDVVFDKGGVDTFSFSDINKSDVTLSVEGKDLIVTINATESVTFKDYLIVDNRIENITFADGVKLDYGQIIQEYGVSSSDDTVELTNADDTVDALGGDDTVKAFSGNDTITGGKGNDTLDGGSGSDTYIFNLGDGQDTIIDASGNDTIKLGDSITQDMLRVQRVGSDFILAIKENGVAFGNLSDKITIKNSSVENVQFSDGTNIDITLLQTPSEGDDTLLYANSAVNVDALGGNDTITTGSSDDTVAGGSGDDTIATNAGNDTVDGGVGADVINAGEGDKIKSKNTTHKPLNNICTSNTFAFINKQDIMTDYLKRVA